MGSLFFPRGGSAHVSANLARNLPRSGWDVTLVTGSVRTPGGQGDATAFYAGLDVHPVDMTGALSAPDPLLADPPLHPSYEDRPGAPDRSFLTVDDHTYRHQVVAWAHALRDAGAARADVLHLHHLTPLNAAAQRVAPHVPVVGHLHGTELLMLEEALERTSAQAEAPHARAWVERLRRWAGRCERLIVLSDNQVDRAERLLGIDPERCVRVSNGFDPAMFVPRTPDRASFWREQLVDRPQGWAPGADAGSVAYDDQDLEGFAGGAPVLLYVGRFTAVKRTELLIEAYTRAREGFDRRAPLVLVGGYPGEWEGEHPLETIQRIGAEDVFLAGWHGHDELPDFFGASDVVVLPSVREQFGQVLVEGMACGLPAIAVDAHGPAEIVRHGQTGWLVEPDDAVGLANALVESVNRPDERRRRGQEARQDVQERFSWPALAEELAAVYAEVADGRPLTVA
jgi:glycosyltransferase involved in cell wall biosynthesis